MLTPQPQEQQQNCEDEILVRQLLTPQPLELPTIDLAQGSEHEGWTDDGADEYVPLFAFEGKPMVLVKKTASGYPAIMGHEKDDRLELQISIFGLAAKVESNGRLIFVCLRDHPDAKKALFSLTSLHAMPPVAKGKRGSKTTKGERARLIVVVPESFESTRTEYKEGKTVLIISMVRPAPARVHTVHPMKTDML
jgi:hypothetical protein